MWECKKYVTKISIKLENGFYIFDDTSVIGKTYLANTLNKYAGYGMPVMSYSYRDYRANRSLKTLLDQDLNVILIDRYDEYEGYCIKKLVEKSKNAIVLVDLKNITEDLGRFDFDKKWCTVQMQENYIEVIS